MSDSREQIAGNALSALSVRSDNVLDSEYETQFQQLKVYPELPSRLNGSFNVRNDKTAQLQITGFVQVDSHTYIDSPVKLSTPGDS